MNENGILGGARILVVPSKTTSLSSAISLILASFSSLTLDGQGSGATQPSSYNRSLLTSYPVGASAHPTLHFAMAAAASAGGCCGRNVPRRQRRAPSCDASASPSSAMSSSSMISVLSLLTLAHAIAAIPSALGFHVAISSGLAACRPPATSFFASPVISRYPPQPNALRMAAASKDDDEPPSASASAAARKATQSLTSPVRKTDRRSPTRIISKPSANARATMTLGGDKIPKSMKKEKSDDTKK